MMTTSRVRTPGRAGGGAPGGSPSWRIRALPPPPLPPLHPASNLQQHLSPRRSGTELFAVAPLRVCGPERQTGLPNPPAQSPSPPRCPSSWPRPAPPAPWSSSRVRRWRAWRSCCVQPRWTPVPSNCSSPLSPRSRWRGRRVPQQGTTPCPSWSASASHCRHADCWGERRERILWKPCGTLVVFM